MLDSANESRSVQPRRYYINVGRSRLIDPPKSKSDSVSVVMSNARIGIDDDDMPFWAYDVIVHPKVFGYYRDDAKYQSDLKSLIFDCVHETHGIKLPPGEATTIENMYKGPFAWTETGQPKEFKPQPDASLDTDPLATLAPSDLLKQLRAAEHIANAPPIPAISDAPSNRIQERAVISTPGIIVATDSLTTPAVNRVPESVSLGGDHAASKTSHQQPHYDLYDSETVWKARVHLPDQACADNLQVDWKPERCIAISSGPNELLRLGIPGDTPLGQPVCKFIKKTRCLSVTVQKGK
ncbi:uncharacterized protein BJ171DRAFT_173188 [Polychytrium aggregatum]|uniref:uncharacterized protein n=1 Tax=Polychytrium aggregatum TaxID=110093 RepID=UPI0022FE5319|nr:uncharacterized protein BJ171DRAFT_173188 [Polychytrium aggregatum]KAI9209010.1 hypothetical protein BJ171DRAFT_173188 [Polychytrium aggregatum]